jgi:hypothetical protein
MKSLSRRSFLATTSGAALTAAHAPFAWPQPLATKPAAEGPWYANAWRRAVIDMHIPDWDPAFLAKFDPGEYAEMLVRSRAQSIVCYCQSHVGLFNYPTRIGHPHRAFAGRNMMKEMIDACHAKGIAVQLYCSLIFDRDAADHHPEWRMRTWEGKFQGEGGRQGILCVNSPYRDYVRAFTEEICQQFDFEGIRFDMTFWPWLCFCDHCAKRFDQEVGGTIPRTVDWFDKKWVAFQRCRERWLTEFAHVATSTVKGLKPDTSVEHQSSTYPLNWMFGVVESLSAENDFLQGDFYGDQLQGSFVRKLLARLTPKRPFGYETSFSLSLQDHTAMKSEALLEAKASAAIADSAAFIFIDAINPDGTVNERAHDRMGKIFDRLMPFYEHLGGERLEDVGIFYSLESKFSMAGNGKPVSAPDTTDTHTQSSMQVAARLIRGHLAFGVITKRNLADLARIRVLICVNVHMMDDEECEAIRAWVRNGGKLIATGGTSLVDKDGTKREDFALGDVFGVQLRQASWTDRVHYLVPTPSGADLLPEYNEKYPAYCNGMSVDVTARGSASVLAKRGMPWPRQEADRFSSIHSDPPWTATETPELVEHRFGQGTALYAASLIELLENAESLIVNAVRRLMPSPSVELEAPGCVEVTLFEQPDRNRYTLSLLNFQKELPNLPVRNIRVRLRLDRPVREVRNVVDGQIVATTQEADVLAFSAQPLQTLLMYELRW